MPPRTAKQVDTAELIALVGPCVADAVAAGLLIDALLELEEWREAAGPELTQERVIRRTLERLKAQGVPRPARVKALQGRFGISRASAYRKDPVSADETSCE
jgi:hypothetical protein